MIKMRCDYFCDHSQEVSPDQKTSWQCPKCAKYHTFIPYSLLPKRDKKKCRKAALRARFGREKPWKPIVIQKEIVVNTPTTAL